MLLEELESPEVAESAAAIRTAVSRLSFDTAEVIVLLTPHARASGVYDAPTGNLAAFGVRSDPVKFETDGSVLRTIAETSGLSVLELDLDHGAVVPLKLARWKLPVVVVGLVESSKLVETLRTTSLPNVAVVASVNGSTGLSPRAPLTELPGAAEAQAEFLSALSADVGSIRGLPLPGTCSTSVIHDFAALFEGSRARVLAHEAPVGVGYMVAEVV